MYPQPLRALIDELGRLPGIGPKSAQRLAFYLLRQPDEDARRLAAALVAMREETSLCEVCCNVADRIGALRHVRGPAARPDDDLRGRGPSRRGRRRALRGLPGTYHVLHGALSPLEGVGADQLHVAELKGGSPRAASAEVILCMNPNVEGDATATFLTKELAAFGVAITRPASGLPGGRRPRVRRRRDARSRARRTPPRRGVTR